MNKILDFTAIQRDNILCLHFLQYFHRVSGSSDEAQLTFTKNWLESHIQDAAALGKPLMFTEFGKSSHTSGYNVSVRDSYLRTIYDVIYASARAGGACVGGLFWQVMSQGMEGWSDGYEVVLSQCPSTASVIEEQSRRIAGLIKCNS